MTSLENERYAAPLLEKLFENLLSVEACAQELLVSLTEIRNQLDRESLPDGFYYVLPPSTWDSDGLRAKRTKAREGYPDHWRPYYQVYDYYHESHADWCDAIRDAQDIALKAGPEFEDGDLPLLDRAASRLHYTLSRMLQSVPTYRVIGPTPPHLKDIEPGLSEALEDVARWTDRLKAFQPSGKPANEAAKAKGVFRWTPETLGQVLVIIFEHPGKSLRHLEAITGIPKSTLQAKAEVRRALEIQRDGIVICRPGVVTSERDGDLTIDAVVDEH